jgi:hypothetical protein
VLPTSLLPEGERREEIGMLQHIREHVVLRSMHQHLLAGKWTPLWA